jgi:hypothetical protein
MILAPSREYNYTGLAAGVTREIQRNETEYGEANQNKLGYG